MRKLKPWESFTLFVLCCAMLGLLLSALTSCATPTEFAVDINPATGKGTATATKAALITPAGGVKVGESKVVDPPEGSWLAIAGTALGAVGLLQFAGPKSWANWAAIFKPSTSWGTTGHALAANFALAHTPKESKSNETQKPA